jgi:peroxiredoxin
MKRQIAISFLLTAATALAAVKTGEPAPDFKLADTRGKQHSLADYKGKYVVLEWVNHDCPFVKKHYDSGNMQQLQKEWVGKEVVWLTINSSAPGKQGNMPAEKWVEVTQQKKAAPTAVLIDEEGTVGKKYGAETTPHMFVINPDGELIYQGAIDSIRSADKEDVPKATNYVDAALESAMAGKPVKMASTKAYGCSVKYQ